MRSSPKSENPTEVTYGLPKSFAPRERLRLGLRRLRDLPKSDGLHSERYYGGYVRLTKNGGDYTETRRGLEIGGSLHGYDTDTHKNIRIVIVAFVALSF